MRIAAKAVFFAVIGLTLFLSSWYVINGDINFSSDIGRDFFLLSEIRDKAIVLIGPRSSTGLFHGPLWLYLNYPAFWLGNGNPVAVGWWWILLIGLFLASGFVIADRLFGRTSAYLYTIMIATYSAFHARGLFNPHGAMFVLPLFFYFFVRYWETRHRGFLAGHLITAAFLIQFQMAIGIPFTLLSLTALSFTMIRARQISHLGFFLILPLLLSNFILFDLRHSFLLSHQVVSFLSPATSSGGGTFNYATYLAERLRLMLGATELLRVDPGNRNLILFLLTMLVVGVQIRDRRHTRTYISFIYFYFGFFLLSIINKGPLLYFYLFPLFPLVFLIFCSLITSRFRLIAACAFGILAFTNLRTAVTDMQYATGHIIGRDLYSWKFLNSLAARVYEGPEPSFGYFVYAPDIFAYEPQYAMEYQRRLTGKAATRSSKQPVTHLVVAPPPPNNPYMEDRWWRVNRVGINTEPVSTETFENGYKIERYELGEDDISRPFDAAIDPGIHFR